MRVLLDACVLYPTVMREVLLGVAAKGLYAPRWSPRLLEEWARAAARHGATDEGIARAEIARLRDRWPDAEIVYPAEAERRFWLPDPNDIHVLAAAVAGSCDAILTVNAKDFPRGILAEEGVARFDPDGFLSARLAEAPDAVRDAATRVLEEARRLSEEDWTMHALMKKARLPRFGKALERTE